eukprot:TRINITY_DN48308_c0_g1_i1.p1 TRINITY_DN48308_c0_g1~~TRINITY_DN48308_c0_g1_i1.p1  ORF type:complete len:185 (-),score=42.78 TRINITY_DN48308_c0_g1_i1:176-730(-)
MDVSHVMENDLLLWKNPVRSGLVFVGMDLAIVLYHFFAPSLLSLVSNLTLAAIAMGGAANLAGLDASQVKIPLPEEGIRNMVRSVGSAVNSAFQSLQHVFLWEDQGDTIKALVALYVLSIFSGWMDVLSCAVVVANLLFVVPIVCAKNKKVIDEVVRPQLSAALGKKDALIAMIPRYTEVYKPA